MPELGRRQGLGVRIQLARKPGDACIHWRSGDLNRCEAARKRLSEPGMAGSAAGRESSLADHGYHDSIRCRGLNTFDARGGYAATVAKTA